MIAGLTWWFTKDMNSVVALLIISCPCALVLASPTAVVATVAAASRLGIFIKNVADIELASQIKAFVFDKTGTLTEGALSVARLAPADGVQPAELLQAAVSVESASNHPVAEALRKLADEAGLRPEKLDKVKETHGKGVTAYIGKRKHQVGREAWLKNSKVDFASLKKDNPYGRCVWRCDNDVVDHQSVVVTFEDGCTATHNMVGGTARPSRAIHLLGTKGEIQGVAQGGLTKNQLVQAIEELLP